MTKDLRIQKRILALLDKNPGIRATMSYLVGQLRDMNDLYNQRNPEVERFLLVVHESIPQF
ncbi:MAG: hypothetical protein HY459_01020 [Parcubacteria group bacterium]|nr:hypothetical protein [Parcubacteria group bacterium]